MATPQALEVRPRPRWVFALWVVAVVAVLACAAWYATSPRPLATSDRTLEATTPVDQPVYLGVFTNDVASGRTLQFSGVKVTAQANVDADIRSWVCRGGSLVVTSAPDAFCQDLADPEGSRLSPGDSVVLEVSAANAGEVRIDRVRLAYRVGAQWATQAAGSPALVRFLAR